MNIFRKIMQGNDAILTMYRNDLGKAQGNGNVLDRMLLVSWANLKSTTIGGVYLTVVFSVIFSPGLLFYFMAKHNSERQNLYANIGGIYFLVLLAIIVVAIVVLIVRPIVIWVRSTRARSRYADSLKAQGSRRIR